MITQAELKKILHYDPDTGIWIWIDAPNHNTRYNGKRAGNVRYDGYRVIRIGGRGYYSGRLAFLYMKGYFPDEVDHKDRDPTNDSWSNLREANRSLNMWNTNKVSATGYKGVYEYDGRYQARAGNTYLGTYSTIEEAVAVRDKAALEMAGEFAFLNGDQT